MTRHRNKRLGKQAYSMITAGLLALVVSAGISTQAAAMSVIELDGFSDNGTLGVVENGLVLAAGDYTASLFNMDIAGAFSDLSFALLDSSNNLVLKLTNSVGDSTTSQLFSLAGGSYTAILGGVTSGYSYAHAQVEAVPLPASVFLLGGAFAALASIGRRKSLK